MVDEQISEAMLHTEVGSSRAVSTGNEENTTRYSPEQFVSIPLRKWWFSSIEYTTGNRLLPAEN